MLPDSRKPATERGFKLSELVDASYYETQLVRAVESVLSPLGWDQNDIRRELNGTRVVGITDWT
jgi:DNA polymerase I